MKKLAVLLSLILLILSLFGCAHPVQDTDLAGKTFCYEKEGFGGDFTITLHDDGTMSYYEGGLSSYIGMGTWTLEDGIVIITDEVYPFTNRFLVEDGKLVFQEADSTNFMYLQLPDGARFFALE